MDYSALIGAVIKLVVEISERHRQQHPNEPLTDEIVKAELRTEMASGQSAIAQEFIAKGVTLPD